MVPLYLCSVVFCGFLMCAYVCRVINKTTFGSFSVLYIQIPYLSLLIQNSGEWSLACDLPGELLIARQCFTHGKPWCNQYAIHMFGIQQWMHWSVRHSKCYFNYWSTNVNTQSITTFIPYPILRGQVGLQRSDYWPSNKKVVIIMLCQMPIL